MKNKRQIALIIVIPVLVLMSYFALRRPVWISILHNSMGDPELLVLNPFRNKGYENFAEGVFRQIQQKELTYVFAQFEKEPSQDFVKYLSNTVDKYHLNSWVIRDISNRNNEKNLLFLAKMEGRRRNTYISVNIKQFGTSYKITSIEYGIDG